MKISPCLYLILESWYILGLSATSLLSSLDNQLPSTNVYNSNGLIDISQYKNFRNNDDKIRLNKKAKKKAPPKSNYCTQTSTFVSSGSFENTIIGPYDLSSQSDKSVASINCNTPKNTSSAHEIFETIGFSDQFGESSLFKRNVETGDLALSAEELSTAINQDAYEIGSTLPSLVDDKNGIPILTDQLSLPYYSWTPPGFITVTVTVPYSGETESPPTSLPAEETVSSSTSLPADESATSTSTTTLASTSTTVRTSKSTTDSLSSAASQSTLVIVTITQYSTHEPSTIISELTITTGIVQTNSTISSESTTKTKTLETVYITEGSLTTSTVVVTPTYSTASIVSKKSGTRLKTRTVETIYISEGDLEPPTSNIASTDSTISTRLKTRTAKTVYISEGDLETSTKKSTQKEITTDPTSLAVSISSSLDINSEDSSINLYTPTSVFGTRTPSSVPKIIEEPSSIAPCFQSCINAANSLNSNQICISLESIDQQLISDCLICVETHPELSNSEYVQKLVDAINYCDNASTFSESSEHMSTSFAPTSEESTLPESPVVTSSNSYISESTQEPEKTSSSVIIVSSDGIQSSSIPNEVSSFSVPEQASNAELSATISSQSEALESISINDENEGSDVPQGFALANGATQLYGSIVASQKEVASTQETVSKPQVPTENTSSMISEPSISYEYETSGEESQLSVSVESSQYTSESSEIGPTKVESKESTMFYESSKTSASIVTPTTESKVYSESESNSVESISTIESKKESSIYSEETIKSAESSVATTYDKTSLQMEFIEDVSYEGTRTTKRTYEYNSMESISIPDVSYYNIYTKAEATTTRRRRRNSAVTVSRNIGVVLLLFICLIVNFCF